MKHFILAMSLSMVAGLAAGCGDDDGNGSDPTNVNMNITGAHDVNWQYDATNDVSCADDNGRLHVHFRSSTTTYVNSMDMLFDGYTGPGNYDFTYDPQEPLMRSVTVYVGENYEYEYGYDYSRLDGTEVFSHCWVVIHGDEEHLGVDISCDDLTATDNSADYETDPAEFQPSINLEGFVLCPLYTL